MRGRAVNGYKKAKIGINEPGSNSSIRETQALYLTEDPLTQD